MVKQEKTAFPELDTFFESEEKERGYELKNDREIISLSDHSKTKSDLIWEKIQRQVIPDRNYNNKQS